MLEEHLSRLCQQTKPKLRMQLEAVLTTAHSHIRKQILHGRTSVPASGNLLTRIQTLHSLHPPYEEQLREHRLKEALRLQQELSEKLTYIADTIHTLAVKPKEKPTRKQLQEMEEKKRLESEEFTKKLREQQKAIELHREKVLAEMTLQQMQLEKEERQKAEMQAQALAAEREKRVEQLRLKRMEREHHLSQVRLRVRESPEPRKELSLSLPEIQPLKPAQRPLVTKEELDEHQRKYEEMKKLGQERRRQHLSVTASAPHLPLSKGMQRVLLEQKKMKEEAEIQAAFRLQILKKQKEYAHIVRTEHLPTIDKKKAAEIQAAKEPRKRSASPEPRLNVTVPRPRPRPKPKPKEEPKEEQKPEAPPRDFLEEQRRAQLSRLTVALEKLRTVDTAQLQSLPSEEKRSQLAALEAQARQGEALLSRLNPGDSEALRVEEGVNSLLLSSIKAKLALLAPSA